MAARLTKRKEMLGRAESIRIPAAEGRARMDPHPGLRLRIYEQVLEIILTDSKLSDFISPMPVVLLCADGLLVPPPVAALPPDAVPPLVPPVVVSPPVVPPALVPPGVVPLPVVVPPVFPVEVPPPLVALPLPAAPLLVDSAIVPLTSTFCPTYLPRSTPARLPISLYV